MRKDVYLILSLLILSFKITSGQNFDTLKKPIGINFSTSTSYSVLDKETSEFLENFWTWEYHDFGIHYSNISLTADFSMTDLKTKTSFEIDDLVFNESKTVEMNKIRLKFGLRIQLGEHYDIEPYGGYNFLKLENKYDRIETNHNGFSVGLNFSRNIEVSPIYSFGIFIGGSINNSGLSKSNNELGNYYYSFCIGIKYLTLSFMK